jgi:hypothetical protein
MGRPCILSGREDSNLRSLVPQTSTLTGLCYAPKALLSRGCKCITFAKWRRGNVEDGKGGRIIAEKDLMPI